MRGSPPRRVLPPRGCSRRSLPPISSWSVPGLASGSSRSPDPSSPLLYPLTTTRTRTTSSTGSVIRPSSSMRCASRFLPVTPDPPPSAASASSCSSRSRCTASMDASISSAGTSARECSPHSASTCDRTPRSLRSREARCWRMCASTPMARRISSAGHGPRPMGRHSGASRSCAGGSNSRTCARIRASGQR